MMRRKLGSLCAHFDRFKHLEVFHISFTALNKLFIVDMQNRGKKVALHLEKC